jgi:hypothetical protein
MGAAMEQAMHDIREMVGINSDPEECAEGDEDYDKMSKIRGEFFGRPRADSDTTNNGASDGGSYFRGKKRGPDAY